MVVGQSYLVYLKLRDQLGGYQITLTLEVFRTPFVSDGVGGWVAGAEEQIALFNGDNQIRLVWNSDPSGHGDYWSGWLNIQRIALGGVAVEQQWDEIPIFPPWGDIPDDGQDWEGWYSWWPITYY